MEGPHFTNHGPPCLSLTSELPKAGGDGHFWLHHMASIGPPVCRWFFPRYHLGSPGIGYEQDGSLPCQSCYLPPSLSLPCSWALCPKNSTEVESPSSHCLPCSLDATPPGAVNTAGRRPELETRSPIFQLCFLGELSNRFPCPGLDFLWLAGLGNL